MPDISIIIVEDEEPIEKLLRLHLGKIKFKVVASASTGPQAIRAAEQFRPDLLLMDIGLKGEMDGIEAARLIRFAFNIPTIFITGDPHDETFERSKSAKPIGYILKPIDFKSLKHTIDTALDSYQTSFKEMEYALRQAEMRYRDLFEHAVQGVFRVTPEGKFLEVNPSLAKMLGYDSPEQMMDCLIDLKHLLVEPEALKEMHRIVKETGQLKDFEFQAYHRNGSRMWLLQNTRSVLNLEGNIIWLEGTIQNITERKEAEEEIKQSRRYLSTIINCIRDPIFVKDSSLRYVLVNDSFCKWTNLGPDEIIGKTAKELFPGLNTDSWDQSDVNVLVSGDDVTTEEELPDYRGDLHTVMIRKFPLLDEHGNKQIVGVVRDITDIKRAEEQRRQIEAALCQSQKLEAIGQLAAGIAHEINTPIQYVADNLNFLQGALANLDRALRACAALAESACNGRLDPEIIARIEKCVADYHLTYVIEEIPKAISQSLAGVDRIASIVRAMREYAHPGKAEKQSADLNDIVRRTLTVCHNQVKYIAEVITDLSPDIPPVPCLPGDISQVILNLIVNAADAIAQATDEGKKGKGKISIQTRKDGNWVEIRVCDTGAGISEENRHKIFSPFFTTKEAGKGTGQGLAISRSIVVAKHGGTIDFETEVGKGTTFNVRLPLASHIS